MCTKNYESDKDKNDEIIDEPEEVISGPAFSSWLVTAIMILIPILNCFYIFEVASGHTKHPEKINFAKAMIPWMILFYIGVFVALLLII